MIARNAERRPRQDAAAYHVPAARPERHEDSARQLLVAIVERRVSATVRCPNAEAAAILRRVVPSSARDRGASYGEFSVFRSHVRRLAEALSAAGYAVDRRSA